jgi:hypothetical protein
MLKFSPSQLSRHAACPASWKHEQGRKEESSEYAQDGTHAHALVEQMLKGWVKKERPANIHYVSWGKTHTAAVTDEMWEAANLYCDYVRGMLDEYSELHSEVKVEAIPKLVSGTCDTLVLQKFGVMRVIDFKYGEGVLVSPYENIQCVAYALGALNKYKKWYPVSVEIHIVQPRARQGDIIKVWAIEDPIEFKHQWTSELESIIAKCRADNPEFIPGDHCSFCKGKQDCPALQKTAKDIIKMDPTAIETIDIDQLLYFADRAPAVRKFLAAVEAELMARAHSGQQIPGRKLVESLSDRMWKAEGPVIELCEKMGVEDYYTTPKLISPAQLEKKLGKDGKKLVADLTVREQRGKNLVVDKDPRPELGSEGFAPVVEAE